MLSMYNKILQNYKLKHIDSLFSIVLIFLYYLNLV